MLRTIRNKHPRPIPTHEPGIHSENLRRRLATALLSALLLLSGLGELPGSVPAGSGTGLAVAQDAGPSLEPEPSVEPLSTEVPPTDVPPTVAPPTEVPSTEPTTIPTPTSTPEPSLGSTATPTPTATATATATPSQTTEPTIAATGTPEPTATVPPSASPATSASASPSAQATRAPRTARPGTPAAAPQIEAQGTSGPLTLTDAAPNDRTVLPGEGTTFQHQVSLDCGLLGCVLGGSYGITFTITPTVSPSASLPVTLTRLGSGGGAVTPSGNSYQTIAKCPLLGGLLGCATDFNITVTVPAGTSAAYAASLTIAVRITSRSDVPAQATDRFRGSPSVTLTITSPATVNFGAVAATGRQPGTTAAVTPVAGLLGTTYVYPRAVTVTVTSNVAWTGTCRIAAGTQTSNLPTASRVLWRVNGASTLATFPATGATATRDACFPDSAAGTYPYVYDLALDTQYQDSTGSVNATITYTVGQQ